MSSRNQREIADSYERIIDNLIYKRDALLRLNLDALATLYNDIIEAYEKEINFLRAG